MQKIRCVLTSSDIVHIYSYSITSWIQGLVGVAGASDWDLRTGVLETSS